MDSYVFPLPTEAVRTNNPFRLAVFAGEDIFSKKHISDTYMVRHLLHKQSAPVLEHGITVCVFEAPESVLHEADNTKAFTLKSEPGGTKVFSSDLFFLLADCTEDYNNPLLEIIRQYVCRTYGYGLLYSDVPSIDSAYEITSTLRMADESEEPGMTPISARFLMEDRHLNVMHSFDNATRIIAEELSVKRAFMYNCDTSILSVTMPEAAWHRLEDTDWHAEAKSVLAFV